MLIVTTQAVLLFIIGMFLFFAVMDVCCAIDRAWTNAMMNYTHRHEHWVLGAGNVPVLVTSKSVVRRKVNQWI